LTPTSQILNTIQNYLIIRVFKIIGHIALNPMQPPSQPWGRYRLIALLLAAVLIGPAGAACAADSSREARLAAAQRELQIGRVTEARIADALAGLQASGQATPEQLHLYETYLDRVQQLTAAKQRVVEALTAAGPPGTAPAAAASPVSAGHDPAIPEDQELDRLRALETELERSLADFDEMLLRETEISRVASERKMQQLAREAAQAAKDLKATGTGAGGGTAEAESGLQGGQTREGDGRKTGEMSEEGAGSAAGREGPAGSERERAGSSETGAGNDQTPRGEATQRQTAGQGQPPSGESADAVQDDDIVARQLREAAEKETDPELKARLWKEYHDYKKSL